MLQVLDCSVFSFTNRSGLSLGIVLNWDFQSYCKQFWCAVHSLRWHILSENCNVNLKEDKQEDITSIDYVYLYAKARPLRTLESKVNLLCMFASLLMPSRQADGFCHRPILIGLLDRDDWISKYWASPYIMNLNYYFKFDVLLNYSFQIIFNLMFKLVFMLNYFFKRNASTVRPSWSINKHPYRAACNLHDVCILTALELMYSRLVIF